MKRARLLVLGIAIFAALGAALLARGFLGSPSTKTIVKTDYDTVKVLVAKTDIHLGDIVNSGSLRWQNWPQEAAGSGYITQVKNPKAISEFIGAIARAPFLPGEPIKNQKLIKKSEGGVMAAILPRGMRAISTGIDEKSAAGKFILPNDRVDVILTRRMTGRDGRSEAYVSDTLFRNIRVLAIGQIIEIKEDEKFASGNTATLELTPSQAETLALASAMGNISLTLRSLADWRHDKKSGKDGREVLGSNRGNSIRLLRYGVQSRAYGVN